MHPPAGSVLATTLSIVKEAIKKSMRTAHSSLIVNHWLDRSKLRYGGTYSNWEVEDVKKVYRLLPIFGTFILYWTVYFQVSVIVIVSLLGSLPAILLPFSFSLHPAPCLSHPFSPSYPIIFSSLHPPSFYHPISFHSLHSPYNPSLLSLAPSKSSSHSKPNLFSLDEYIIDSTR